MTQAEYIKGLKIVAGENPDPANGRPRFPAPPPSYIQASKIRAWRMNLIKRALDYQVTAKNQWRF